MNLYHSFITGLPDLEFSQEANALAPEQFSNSLEEILPPEENELVRLLWHRKFHGALTAFIAGEKTEAHLPQGIRKESFSDSHENFSALPWYIRETVLWKKSRKKTDTTDIAVRLAGFYFRQMDSTNNSFMRQWADMEMNFLNFLATRRTEMYGKEKEKQLIQGNRYAYLLLEFPFSHKIIKTEFFLAEKLETLILKTNILTREFEMDKLKWKAIDEINRFSYFTVDIILGYFQKLMLLDRWTRIFNSQTQVDPLTIAREHTGAISPEKETAAKP